MDKIKKIRQEIERHRQAIRVLNEHTAPEQTSKTCAIFQYSDTILSELLSFIDSLPDEERPEGIEPYNPGYDEAYLNEKIAKASDTWKGVDVDKYLDEVRGGDKEEQFFGITKMMDGTLEEAAEEYFYRNWSDGSLDIKPQVKEDFKAGAEWQKKQMMKEAVEGEVIKTDKHTSVRYKAFYGTDRYFYGIADKQFKPGDKVRILVLKSEEE